MADAIQPASSGMTSMSKPRLGEELPIFCEKCGYSLYGLPQVRCTHCDILQFHCPECGHHQPINTLRPAVQRILGRARAWLLGFWVFFRINFFFWLLLAWFGMGFANAYQADWNTATSSQVIRGYKLTFDSVLMFMIFAIPFALTARLLLLRWRRGMPVGMALGAAAVLAMCLGALSRRHSEAIALSPFSGSFLAILGITFVAITISGALSWPIWVMCVHLFLRKNLANALLDWQRGTSAAASILSRN